MQCGDVELEKKIDEKIEHFIGSSCQFLFLILEFSVVSINQLKSQLFEMVFSSFDTVNFQ